MAKRKVNLGGQEFMAEEVEFEAEGAEKWNTYLLQDGTKLKMKAVVSDVLRLDGQYAPNGDPLYSVNTQVVVNTVSPDTLKRRS
jgi:hypothetical protein